MKNADRNDFEIIFISSDNSLEEFQTYHKKMPWPALPYEIASERNIPLRQFFGGLGIPWLITLDSTGALSNQNARSMVFRDPGGEDFPWA